MRLISKSSNIRLHDCFYSVQLIKVHLMSFLDIRKEHAWLLQWIACDQDQVVFSAHKDRLEPSRITPVSLLSLLFTDPFNEV